MSDIFLSYSRDDQAIARQFAEGFEREGLSVWWDQTLKPGQAYDRVTEKALQDAKAVVVLWSKKSVESHWVRSEATQAQANGTLVPVMIEACKRPIMFELMHTAELAQWKGDANDSAWRTFLGDVLQFVKKEPPATSPSAVQSVSTQPRQFNVRILVGIIALLVVGPGMFWLAHQLPRVSPKQAAATAGTSATAAKEVTLAVLPFANLSSDPSQEFFSDGLTEEILNQLAQVKGLVVTGRTSSFSFKGKNEDLRLIAEKLGVTNLLEGSVRKDANQLRVTAQLINGKNGAHLWSHTYERELKDVFSVQDEIATDVANALSVALGAVEFSHAEGGTNVPEALEYFLQARALSQNGRESDFEQIVQLTREAVKLDPNFAMAWFMLADYLHRPLPETPVDAAQEMERTEAIKRRDAATPPKSGLADFNRAWSFMTDRKWVEAEPLVMQAYEAGPKYSRYLASNQYVRFLQSVGRAREAVVASERLRRFDPLAMGPSEGLQQALDAAGRPDDAQVEYLRSKSLDGSHVGSEYLAAIRLLLRPNLDMSAVHTQFQRLATNRDRPLPLFDKLSEQLSDRKAIRETLASTFADPMKQDAPSLQGIAGLAAAFGERDLALAAIRGAISRGASVSLVWIGSKDSLRTDPKFKDIVRELGLVAYWRTSGKWGDFCKPLGKDDFECH